MLAHRWRNAIVALAALVLLWRIFTVNGALSGVRPGMLESGDSSTPSGVETLREVLHRNPAEVGGLVLLGQAREAEGGTDDAAKIYRLAAMLAPEDPTVIAATAAYFLRHGAVRDGMRMMGQLAEYHGHEAAFPVFTQLLASGGHSDVWAELLANDPKWLGPFIIQACSRDLDARRLLLARVAAGHRNAPEIGCVIDRLRAQDRWMDAYQLWLDTLPRERLADVGYVFNGGFEQTPSGVGFDWILGQPDRNSGHTAELLPTLGALGSRALRVDYNGKRQSGAPASQFTMLPPGHYRLSGVARSEGLKTGRGVQWVMRCSRAGKPDRLLASSERLAGPSEWHRFEFRVDVPPDCAGQLLALEPVDAQYGNVFLSGRLWFDDIALRRLAQGTN
jgi:hypothetical protein